MAKVNKFVSAMIRTEEWRKRKLVLELIVVDGLLEIERKEDRCSSAAAATKSTLIIPLYCTIRRYDCRINGNFRMQCNGDFVDNLI